MFTYYYLTFVLLWTVFLGPMTVNNLILFSVDRELRETSDASRLGSGCLWFIHMWGLNRHSNLYQIFWLPWNNSDGQVFFFFLLRKYFLTLSHRISLNLLNFLDTYALIKQKQMTRFFTFSVLKKKWCHWQHFCYNFQSSKSYFSSKFGMTKHISPIFYSL